MFSFLLLNIPCHKYEHKRTQTFIKKFFSTLSQGGGGGGIKGKSGKN